MEQALITNIGTLIGITDKPRLCGAEMGDLHSIENAYLLIENGKIAVLPPKSKEGDKLVLQALADVRLGIAACSVSESGCNSGKCGAIKIIIGD